MLAVCVAACLHDVDVVAWCLLLMVLRACCCLLVGRRHHRTHIASIIVAGVSDNGRTRR